MSNIFAELPDHSVDELFEAIAVTGAYRVERIISYGHASPPGFWYDQKTHEWVLVLRGRACVRFEDDGHLHELAPGDYLDIAPHRRHRVEWTSEDEPTIWLAIHGRAEDSEFADADHDW